MNWSDPHTRFDFFTPHLFKPQLKLLACAPVPKAPVVIMKHARRQRLQQLQRVGPAHHGHGDLARPHGHLSHGLRIVGQAAQHRGERSGGAEIIGGTESKQQNFIRTTNDQANKCRWIIGL